MEWARFEIWLDVETIKTMINVRKEEKKKKLTHEKATHKK